jgi:hypothetical protein
VQIYRQIKAIIPLAITGTCISANVGEGRTAFQVLRISSVVAFISYTNLAQWKRVWWRHLLLPLRFYVPFDQFSLSIDKTASRNMWAQVDIINVSLLSSIVRSIQKGGTKYDLVGVSKVSLNGQKERKKEGKKDVDNRFLQNFCIYQFTWPHTHIFNCRTICRSTTSNAHRLSNAYGTPWDKSQPASHPYLPPSVFTDSTVIANKVHLVGWEIPHFFHARKASEN